MVDIIVTWSKVCQYVLIIDIGLNWYIFDAIDEEEYDFFMNLSILPKSYR